MTQTADVYAGDVAHPGRVLETEDYKLRILGDAAYDSLPRVANAVSLANVVPASFVFWLRPDGKIEIVVLLAGISRQLVHTIARKLDRLSVVTSVQFESTIVGDLSTIENDIRKLGLPEVKVLDAGGETLR